MKDFSIGMTAVSVLLIVAAGFVSCDNNDDAWEDDRKAEDVFTPSVNMTQGEITDLLEEALQATLSSNETAITCRDTIHVPGHPSLSPECINGYFSVDRKNRKSLEIEHEKDNDAVIRHYAFTEGDTCYRETYRSYRLTDLYWADYMDIYKIRRYLSGMMEYDFDEYTWHITGNTFTGIIETILPPMMGYPNIRTILTILLTQDKKIKYARSYTEPFVNLYMSVISSMIAVSSHERKFEYTANTALPAGYKISDFIPYRQYRIEVIWEDESRDIFYEIIYPAGKDADGDGIVEDGITALFQAYSVSIYFPWETIYLFHDRDFTQPVDSERITSDVTYYGRKTQP